MIQQILRAQTPIRISRLESLGLPMATAIAAIRWREASASYSNCIKSTHIYETASATTALAGII